LSPHRLCPCSRPTWPLALLHLTDLETPHLLLGTRHVRHYDLQDSVAEIRRCLRGINTLGQRNGAVEGAVPALAVAVSLSLLLLLLLALALDREQVTGHLHLDLLLAHARQVCMDNQLPFTLQHVDPRRPLGRYKPHLAAHQ